MIRRLLLACGLAVLCVNVTAKPKPLPMPLAPELPVEVVLNQHELAVDVPATATAVGAQFGLIGALVGAGIQNAQVKNAEERVMPLRDLLLEYRFNERLEAALRAKLASDGLSPAPVITVMKSPWDALDAQQSKQDMPLHAMVLIPRYSIDSDFQQLSVTLTAQVVDRTVKPNGKVKTRYAFSRAYAFRFPLLADTGENLPRWIGAGGPHLAGLLDQGIEQTVDMLVYDFSAEGRAQWDQKIKRENVTLKGLMYAGLAVRKTDDWVWVRSGRNFMQTVHGYRPVTATAAPASVTSAAAVVEPATSEVAPGTAPVTAPMSGPMTAPSTAPGTAPAVTPAGAPAGIP
ncbi:MAG: hypothetical protein AVDCRST_MAG71-2046 [uncultured Lysobacter sp.]|uniref:Uncharacterized protein n=1 Tax=uncultured Lysobacter sp. TaxID=271060 RepID=A0A6J4LM37_9GAMM|nr:MAG: hypothetical protein AVDCRST_MAG71-2046 [uncultured Lysobacter sp.]